MTSRYDEPITLRLGAPLRLSADAIRCLEKGSGQTISELQIDEGDLAGQMQVRAFAELYRRYARAGHLPDAGELWERASAVELELVADTPDPLGAGSSTISPPSAATGG